MSFSDRFNKMSFRSKLNGAMFVTLLPCAVVGGYGLSDQAGAQKTLDNAGYTVLKYEGHKVFGCGKGDLWRDSFTVKNAKDKEVQVEVCKGVFKGSTVRF